MKSVLCITDLTRMQEGRVCIAGYDRDGKCIRPVLPPPGILEPWLLRDGRAIIFPFAIVEMDLLQATPMPPHCEDVRFDRASLRAIGRLAPEKAKIQLEQSLFPGVAAIFGNRVCSGEGHYVMDGDGARSLGTVKPAFIERASHELEPGGKWKYRLAFRDGAGRAYRLTVTDLTWRYYVDSLRREGATPEEIGGTLTALLRGREVLLRIGLARGWDLHPERCYLQITGVYTFPEYHEGRTFADFGAPSIARGADAADGPPADLSLGVGPERPASGSGSKHQRAPRTVPSLAARAECAPLVADYERALCRLIMQTIAASPVPISADEVAGVLNGGQSAFLVRNRLHETGTYGILPTFPRRYLIAVIGAMVRSGLLTQEFVTEFEYWPYLKATPPGLAFLKGVESPAVSFAFRLAQKEKVTLSEADQVLYDVLLAFRRDLARAEGIPDYKVCNDAVLRELSRRRPASEPALREAHGVGSRFAAKYGKAFLDLIAAQADLA